MAPAECLLFETIFFNKDEGDARDAEDPFRMASPSCSDGQGGPKAAKKATANLVTLVFSAWCSWC
jgi:hypothetical protein